MSFFTIIFLLIISLIDLAFVSIGPSSDKDLDLYYFLDFAVIENKN
jgi:hypothetical protein